MEFCDSTGNYLTSIKKSCSISLLFVHIVPGSIQNSDDIGQQTAVLQLQQYVAKKAHQDSCKLP